MTRLAQKQKTKSKCSYSRSPIWNGNIFRMKNVEMVLQYIIATLETINSCHFLSLLSSSSEI